METLKHPGTLVSLARKYGLSQSGMGCFESARLTLDATNLSEDEKFWMLEIPQTFGNEALPFWTSESQKDTVVYKRGVETSETVHGVLRVYLRDPQVYAKVTYVKGLPNASNYYAQQCQCLVVWDKDEACWNIGYAPAHIGTGDGLTKLL
jgi:hypothetical protein